VTDRGTIVRPTARVLLIDPEGSVLLLHALDGEYRGADTGPVWLTPGGGLEPGETHQAAALRELPEEVGRRDLTLGPCVWLRTFPFLRDDTRWEKRERYFLTRCDRFEVDRDLWKDLDTESVGDFRWWSVADIAASGETFVPRNLASLLPPLLSGEYPNEPFEVGI
jgi:8-oxo-dGTP pyrophosphatase MutT (NUDIX family)